MSETKLGRANQPSDEPALDVLASTLGALPDAAIIVAAQGDDAILAANEAAERLYGAPRSALLGRRWGDLSLAGSPTLAEVLAAPRAVDALQRREGGAPLTLEVAARSGTLAGRPVALCTLRDVSAQRASLSALRLAERSLAMAVGLARLGIWDWDPASDAVTWNDEMLRIYGVSREAFTARGQDYIAFTHPDFRETQLKNLAAAFAAARTEEAFLAAGMPEGSPKELRILRPDGSERVTLGDAIALVDGGGRPSRMLGVTVDVTEFRRTQEALGEWRATLDAVIGCTDDLVWAVDAEHLALRFFNRAMHEHVERTHGIRLAVGLRPEDLQGEPGGGPHWRERYARALAEGRLTVEYDGPGADGRSFVLHLTRLERAGRPFGVAVFAHDVTALRRSRAVERRQHELLEHAIETAGLSLYELVDEEVRFIDARAGAAIGYSPGLGEASRFWGDHVHPEDAAAVREAQRAVRAGERERIAIEYRFLHPTRGVIWLNHQARILRRRPDGSAQHVVGVMREVTEQRAAELERARLADQLRHSQKMEAIGVLAGGVAHDFNNMLGVIFGSIDFVLEALGADHPAREDAEEIQRSAERASAITRQLLAFARKQTIAPRDLDLGEAVEGALKMIRRLVGEDVEVVWRPAPRSTRVHMDPAQLDQVLANLAANARDAIAGVGRMVIATRVANIDDTFCEANPGARAGTFVVLSVTDDGVGMSAETQARIWEPFFTTKELGRGTGLGLPTVLGIVKQNGGFVSVHSQPGQGATFDLHLPRIAEAHADANVTVAGDLGPEGVECILLVEDEPAQLNICKKVLVALGYQVLAARPPSDAVAVARQAARPIELILTDVIMPGMNGRELVREVQALHPGARCLYMSGYPADVIASRGVLDDGVALLLKPFTRRELAARVRAALDERAQ